METPFKIISTKRWREMNQRAVMTDRAIDALARRIDAFRGELASVERIVCGLRLDVKNIRRKLNEKPRNAWQFTGK